MSEPRAGSSACDAAFRASMSKATTVFIGLDVHRNSISVAYAAEERGSEIVFVGQVGPRRCRVHTLSDASAGTRGVDLFLKTSYGR